MIFHNTKWRFIYPPVVLYEKFFLILACVMNQLWRNYMSLACFLAKKKAKSVIFSKDIFQLVLLDWTFLRLSTFYVEITYKVLRISHILDFLTFVMKHSVSSWCFIEFMKNSFQKPIFSISQNHFSIQFFVVNSVYAWFS